jgi:NAD(P) transhydrogenase
MIGVHIFGEGAAELLHIGQAVFSFKGKVTYFKNTVLNLPPPSPNAIRPLLSTV